MIRPFISICIPAYKRIEFIARLLESISIQTFTNYEVIITDDSDDNKLSEYIKNLQIKNISYFLNPNALGSPNNWNRAISLANGEWIKLMHDDDWFADKHSLQKFADAALDNKSSFIFSGFEIVDMQTRKGEQYVLASSEEYLLKKSPLNLLRKNFIGHPSTTLIRNDQDKWYDDRLKWLVDIEFYIRVLQNEKQFIVIREPLIKIGKSEEQITQSVFRNPEIEIPEHLYLLGKLSPSTLKNIVVYDHFWRLLRNLSIRDLQTMEQHAKGQRIPAVIQTMIRHERRIPERLLHIGPLSKLMMSCSYLFCLLTNAFTK